MSGGPEFTTFEGAEGRIGALRWEGVGRGPTVLAIHGITANAWHFDPLVHQLSGAAALVAVDLRGRGRSFDHPGPFGIRAHAADIAAIVRQLDEPVFLVAHSMGCYVALMALKREPQLVADVLLVDGGTPLPIGDVADVDAVLDETLGPAIERLRTVWPDRVSYHTMWTQHPAYADGISIELERDLLADLIETDGGFRTAVNEDAVRVDGRDLFADDEVRGLLGARTTPTTILRAPRGLMGAPPPLIGDDVVASMPQHRWIDAPGTNHYTLLLGPDGAALVASTLRDQLAGKSALRTS